jgi:amino acid transporter
MATQRTQIAGSPHLTRALGVGDLTWLYVVAVVNLNIVPVVAAEGGRAFWLWCAAIVFFFVPQGIAVIELAERMPGEGGLYLWTKLAFGDFLGFLCGWCYWLTNMFFVPSLLFYVTGVTAYMGAAGLGENRLFFFALTNLLLWATVMANIRGLGVGKWVNNIGGIGALMITFALLAFTAAMIAKRDAHIAWSGLNADLFRAFPVSTLGVVCLAMVGLEIGPVMGDEVRDPRRTFPRAILLGGALCAIAYLGSTMSLASAVPQSEMAVVQGMMQAIDKMSASLGIGGILLPLAVLMIVSIVGSTSAWVSGSARILFVSGLDRYLPKALGRIHPRHGSPHIALAMFGALASSIIAMSFAGASVKEAYLTLLDLAVVIQMISYLLMFSVLVKWSFSASFKRVYFRRGLLCVASVTGLFATLASFCAGFVPSRHISSIWSFEVKMTLTLGLLLGIGCGFFLFNSRKKLRPAGSVVDELPADAV